MEQQENGQEIKPSKEEAKEFLEYFLDHYFKNSYKISLKLFNENPCIQTARPLFYEAFYAGVHLSSVEHKELFRIIAKQIYNEQMRYEDRQNEIESERLMNEEPLRLYRYVMDAKSIAAGYKIWKDDTGNRETTKGEEYNTFYKMLHRDLVNTATLILTNYESAAKEILPLDNQNIKDLTCKNLITLLKPLWDDDAQELAPLIKSE